MDFDICLTIGSVRAKASLLITRACCCGAALSAYFDFPKKLDAPIISEQAMIIQRTKIKEFRGIVSSGIA